MNYVEILVADGSYHGNEPLTYASPVALETGSIVTVPLRAKQVLGVVVKTAEKPRFPTKPIVIAHPLPPLPRQLLQTLRWLHAYYPSSLGATTQQFLPKQLPHKPTPLPAATTPPPANLPPLTADQTNTLNAISQPGTYLLHGETGSGKTRVYIELARRSLESGASAIILTPEIGLTSQLAQDFREVFGDQVVVVHSRLTAATRQRLWLALLLHEAPLVVVGPRSALFSPLARVGFIAIDESHEPSYKQDQAPHYHATRVAGALAAQHKAVLVLGSATPLLSDYYLAQQKQRPILRMDTTAAQHAASSYKTDIVDLRDRSQFTKSPHLSNQLIAAVESALLAGEQSLLFLNRRGTARIILCENCGWQANCPHCDLPLVYHGDAHITRCHSCDYTAPSPNSCPSCRYASVVFKSIGTKAISDEVQRLFPDATIRRFDTDNKKMERIEEQYEDIRRGDVDIIVGTQVLAKGLDLPKLGVVGVVIADTSLYVPDFSSQERTYQLLVQVLGRVGRGHRAGHAIIQTYSPDSPLLEAVLHKDWELFCTKELQERQSFLFPPFCYLLKLSCRRATQTSTQKTAQKLANELRKTYSHIIVEGPTPSFHEKVQNKFQWQLIIKAKNRVQLVDIIRTLPAGWSYDIDPMNLL